MATRPAETVPAEACATTPPVPALASPASTAPSASTRPRFIKRGVAPLVLLERNTVYIKATVSKYVNKNGTKIKVTVVAES